MPLTNNSCFLSVRDKNLQFIQRIAGALQLDCMPQKSSFSKIKKAFTSNAVLQIHESLLELWPDQNDCKRVLSSERDNVTALYLGTYEPAAVFRAITRHSLYCDRILLVDPFIYPKHIVDKFNPLLHPEIHRSMTAKWAFLWLILFPWIESGIVSFIRTPEDFDLTMANEILEIQHAKFRANPLLNNFADRETERATRLNLNFNEFFLLAHPDNYLLDIYRRSSELMRKMTENEFLTYIHNCRDNHPYYLDFMPGQGGHFVHESTGASYESGKRICAISNSHLITDITVRWKEVEFDHSHATGATNIWSPFSKALQSANLNVLNNIPVEIALRLRKEQKLESMRHFFNRVWRTCREPDVYSTANATNLAAELNHEVRNAENEWKAIDKQLVVMLGAAGCEIISAGVVGFVPAAAAAVVTGAMGLALAQWQRKSFSRRFPAGFCLSFK